MVDAMTPACGRFDPAAVAAWLNPRGFHRSAAYGRYGAIFSRGESELLLPTTTTVRDFDRRMVEFWSDLAEAEASTPQALIADFLRSGAELGGT